MYCFQLLKAKYEWGAEVSTQQKFRCRFQNSPLSALLKRGNLQKLETALAKKKEGEKLEGSATKTYM